MTPSIGWLVIFVVVCLLSLWWAASQLTGAKIYHHNEVDYPHNLEFNSSFTFLFTIVVTIMTSVVVGFLAARFIQPGDAGTPNGVTTIVVILIWVAGLAVNVRLLMRAKVVHLTWPDDKSKEKIYPVSIASSIAFSTLFTLSLATMSSTVFAILITQVVRAF